MYQYPVQFPQVSNREDLLLTVALFDDDTGQPVRLDGTQTAAATPFTSAAWTVTDGAIVTASTTGITIPVYPIGNQLSPLPLIVGAGLGIVPGDFIKIADTATGLNTMSGYVQSYNIANGQMVVQIGVTFQFEIRRCGPHYDGSGYISWFDFGVPDEHGPLLQASLGNGILFIDIGIIQILIPANQFRKLHNGTYLVACTATDTVNTRQLFLGQLPVQYGGVTGPQAALPAGAFSGGFA